MKRLVYLHLWVSFLSLPLVACYGGERAQTGECPAGEVCSDQTPEGLLFVGNDLAGQILLSGPRPTAIGGTQAVALQYDRGDGVIVALDVPFTADDDGGLGIAVDAISGSQVIVRGTGSRTNYLRILDEDGLLMDRKQLTGAALDRIDLVSGDLESVPADRQVAFAPGYRTIGVALYGDVQESGGPSSERLVDTSMELTLAGAERDAWDTLSIDAAVGTYALMVTAGDKPTATLDFVVVDHADSVAAIEPVPTAIEVNGSAMVCFEAVTAGRYVAGLTWTYVIDGTDMQVKGDGSLARNCVSVSTQKTSGTVTLEASAGGQMTSMTLAIGAGARTAAAPLAARPRALRPTSHAVPTAGDRAASMR